MHADKTGLAKTEMHFEQVDGIVEQCVLRNFSCGDLRWATPVMRREDCRSCQAFRGCDEERARDALDTRVVAK